MKQRCRVEEAKDGGPISGVQVAIGLPHCMQSKVNHHTSPSVRAEHAIGVVPKSKPKLGVGECLVIHRKVGSDAIANIDIRHGNWRV